MKTSTMIESKYLTKDDAGEDGTVVTIKAFERVNMAQEGKPAEHKWVMYFREFPKGMVMNGTNIQLAEKALGSDETDDWIGKKIIIYDDPNVSFGKELVGGIRIRAHRQAAPPRQVSGNGADDFEQAASVSTNTLANAEQELWDASNNGVEALRVAWVGYSDAIRNQLRPQLEKMKAAAVKADAQPKRQAGDDFSDIPQ